VSKNKPITLLACLKQTTPNAKPIKIGGEGEAEIVLETDAQQLTQVLRLVPLLGQMFRVTVNPE